MTFDLEYYKSRIISDYADRRGSESHERKMLCNEIERLQAALQHEKDVAEAYKAEADALRTAIEKSYRLMAIEREQNRCVSQRAAGCFNGTFGIAVKDDPLAKQWQALETERCCIEQAIRDAMKGGE